MKVTLVKDNVSQKIDNDDPHWKEISPNVHWQEISPGVYERTYVIDALENHDDDGTYKFIVTCIDKSNNSGERISAELVVDTTAPLREGSPQLAADSDGNLRQIGET